MKAFVTGGTGFIGSRVVEHLVARDYQVIALARSNNSATKLRSLGAIPAFGDINDTESMRSAMQNCDIVFHIAGWYKLGSKDWRQAEAVNVRGTRNVLELAYQLGIPKIIYTSTVAVYGDTRGYLADENYIGPAGPFLTEYDRTKWEAHYEVAIPLIENGAPIIIVMPGVVYGPGDHSLIGEMMRLYYRGLFPVLPGPELTLTFAHVDDIAEGHILAAEKGNIGENYLLTGPVMSLLEAAQLWSQISARPEPFLNVPGRYLKPFAPIMKALGSIVPLPEIISHDAIAILEATYIANSNKARRELGWQPRSVQEGMMQTYQWLVEHSSNQPSIVTSLKMKISELNPTQRKQIAIIALGAALGLLAVWILSHRRD